MSRLEIQRSPPVDSPLRFFYGAIAWGIAAGPVMAWLDPALWTTRWHPGLLALVHLMVLGVLGQACLGALLQFLAAAAASPPAGTPLAWTVLHSAWNIGVAALVTGFIWMQPLALQVGGVLLALCLCAACGAMLLGLARSNGPGWLRAGVAIPLVAWPLVAALGVVLVMAMISGLELDLARWTDIHAISGIGLVFMSLLASVALVVMPMLMGTGRPGRWLRWLGFAPATATLSIMLSRLADRDVATELMGATLAAMAAAGLVALAWRPHRRNAPLVAAWRLGLAFAGIAGMTWVAKGPSAGLLPATMLLGGSLPLLVLSMVLEIRAFLGWIGLHRVYDRGRQLPGVHLLLPDTVKWRWLGVQVVAAVNLAWLTVHPSPGLVLAVAGCWCFAFALLALAMGSPRNVARSFQQRWTPAR
jgi:hypothetical protein